MDAGTDAHRNSSDAMSAPETIPYKTAEDFNAALKQQFVAVAGSSPYGVNELRRQFAYDRFLLRIFDADPHDWILKGGVGMLARLPGHARHSMDLDLYYHGELDAAIASLRSLGAADRGDFFTFGIEPTSSRANEGGRQLSITAYIGNREFQRFKIDVSIASNMTQEPDTVAPLTPLSVPGLHSHNYRVYSVVDHIADKHAAMLDTYNGVPSSRYRDLVDLVILANTQRPEAGKLRAAMFSEYVHRGLTPPTTVELPSQSWESGYAVQASKVPWLSQQSVFEGLTTVRAFLDPILVGRDTGTWNPELHEWEDETARTDPPGR